MNSKNILITGASGYVGTALTEKIISDNSINIVNYDISIFGDDHLPKKENYLYIKKDLRDKKSFEKAIKENNIDTVLHLACISNDPTFELKSDISKVINYDCFEDLVKISRKIKLGNLFMHPHAQSMGFLTALM